MSSWGILASPGNLQMPWGSRQRWGWRGDSLRLSWGVWEGEVASRALPRWPLSSPEGLGVGQGPGKGFGISTRGMRI